MEKILNFLLKKWWRPIILLFSCFLLFFLSQKIDSSIFGYISLFFFCIGLFIEIISTMALFTNKNWLKGIITLTLIIGICFLFLFVSIMLFISEQERVDDFAKDLKIPKNISIETPINLALRKKTSTRIFNNSSLKIDFQLYQDIQPGLYRYDFWVNKLEKGKIYLKAFEITSQYELSKDELQKTTTLMIFNPSNTIKKFGTNSCFTIYEGDWGQPYAARFEVWFKPDNGNPERKLISKNYKIEGWMP